MKPAKSESKAASKTHASKDDTSEAVDAFLAQLVHPFKPEVQAIREAILRADPGIAEGIKWNAPSYRTHEYFATTNLREKVGVGVVLHRGAKVRDAGADPVAVADPEGMLSWLAIDRAIVRFANLRDFRAKQDAFEALIRAWIAHV
jgi:hypothetical protein